MIPFVIKCGDLTPGHLSVFRVVANMVNKMPEKPSDGPGLSCHDVCERLIKGEAYLAENLRHVRGRFGSPITIKQRGIYEHSWLEFTQGERVIIDVYPVACGSGPILVVATDQTPWGDLYQEEKRGEG